MMMNNTLAQLRELKLVGMATAVEEQLSSTASTTLTHLRHHPGQTSSESITCEHRPGVVSRFRRRCGRFGGVGISPAAALAAAPRHRR